ncbi:hypothetical protein FHX49_000893 [Microbacterium endophyticum]|uniref:Tryptophan-rich sensory protein n=1 Tax=Microbacterium endophyticum TaxID=1526412 RepID=A0A7W4V1X3_9MICO|nr:tryptophan-rich sensory protein [Microbacterium endophyticum]MBB2975327.1 hypothetical protein [Microbacterium endophyticum]NIK35654.1 hypothetical protein [Microbacterium endophyticum]
MSTTDTSAGRRDIVRQIAVLSATTFMLIAAAVGVGAFGGTAVQDLQGGALDSDGSYLAPASSAFSIWSAIYVLLIAFAVWQALPGQRSRPRQRAIGWWIALTMVLNGFWLLTAQFLTLFMTAVVIVLLLVALALTFRRTVKMPSETWADRLFIDGSTGLHLGWVSLATVANITAWLTQNLPADAEENATFWGITVLVVVAIVGIGIAAASSWRIAPALALTWGLCWLGVGRLTGEPTSFAIGVTAFVVAIIVLVVPVVGTTAKTLRRTA